MPWSRTDCLIGALLLVTAGCASSPFGLAGGSKPATAPREDEAVSDSSLAPVSRVADRSATPSSTQGPNPHENVSAQGRSSPPRTDRGATTGGAMPPPAGDMSFESIERILTAPDNSVPAEYKQYVRDQLIAIASGEAPGRTSNQLTALAHPPTSPPTAAPPSLPGPAPIILAEPPPESLQISKRLAGRQSPPAIRHDVQPAAFFSPDPPLAEPEAAKPTPELTDDPSSHSARDVQPKLPNQPSENSYQRGEWRERLAETLAAIDRERANSDATDHERELLEASARLLHLVANHRDQAVAPREELDDDQREFWKHQLHALMIAVDADDKHAGGRWAALVLRELRAAADHLSNVSALDVRNLAFCEKVDSYGNYTRFNTTTFKPGKEVLLYVEIDNFTVEPTGDQFQTELQAEYTIVDSAGKRFNRKLPLVREDCRNRRHDYFIAYHLVLPEELVPGKYTLELTVEDVKGKKSSQASIDFNIR